jgi:twinkle protein
VAYDPDQRPKTLEELFDQQRIELHGVMPPPERNYGGSRTKLYCPECQGGREKERNFYVKIDGDRQGATWVCHRASCGFSGGVRLAHAPSDRPQRPPRRYRRPEPPTEIHRPDPFIAYWQREHRISKATLEYFGVHRTTRRMPVLDDEGKQTDRKREMPVIAFPYRDLGNLTNCKYKALYPHCGKKRFEQERDAEPTLYNIDSFRDDKAGYFVEGEGDCLAMFECGFQQVTTVPNGSPPKLAETYDPANDDDDRYIPIRPGDERIDRLKACYLAGDMDEAGRRHMEEMARRLGKHRCWLVRWPEGCKDADDTLNKAGPEAVKRAIATATKYPLEGVEFISHDMLRAMYLRQEGWRYRTGYTSLDERLQLGHEEGQLVICTGYPGYGKTSFWTSYAGLLAMRHDQHVQQNPALRPLHTIIFSREAKTADLVRNLVSFRVRKPFLSNRDGDRMTLEEADANLPWVHDHFTFLSWPHEKRGRPKISWVQERITELVKSTGAKLVILDPWQTFDDEMPLKWNKSQSDWIIDRLYDMQWLAEELTVNLVVVVHPKKTPPDKSGKRPVPEAYDIMGSQGFDSVADIGLSIHRPDLQTDEMQLRCWKMRDGRYGKPGDTFMRFDARTQGLYPRPTVAEALRDAESA